MKKRNGSYFLWGFVLSALAFFVIWYWQKSTAAEDGALDLLDRYADMEKRWRQIRQDQSSPELQTATLAAQAEPAPPFNMQQIKGIGPVFDEQLRLAGITNLTKLTAMNAVQLAEVLDIGSTRAANILAEAKKLG